MEYESLNIHSFALLSNGIDRITKIILNPSSNPPPTDATTLVIGAVRRKLLKQDFSKRTSISVSIDQAPVKQRGDGVGRWESQNCHKLLIILSCLCC